MFQGHSIQEPASSRVTLFYSASLYRKRMLATANKGKTQESFWKKMQVNGPEG